MIKGLLLDVEGTIVGDKRYQPVGGGVEFVVEARRRGLKVCLLSNNTTMPADAVIERLNAAGFHFTPDELVLCTSTAFELLRAGGAKRCMVLGTEELQQQFRTAGFEVVDSSRVDAVIVGLDTELTYARLQTACEALIVNKAALIGLHHNRIFTDVYGRVGPSVGAIVAALSYAAHVEPRIVGKPSAEPYRVALKRMGLGAEDVMFISDDPFSDLAGAKRLGMTAAFVLTGKYSTRDILERIPEHERPDVTAETIFDLLDTAWLRPA
jgi:HAD superfamily hydrolase (TIGR01450 family)